MKKMNFSKFLLSSPDQWSFFMCHERSGFFVTVLTSWVAGVVRACEGEAPVRASKSENDTATAKAALFTDVKHTLIDQINQAICNTLTRKENIKRLLFDAHHFNFKKEG
ncbi:MAG: hypothetical protein A2583_04325 [Bdellovibrionales bacterium RIFOXYD1_FULL_53_11]|nr:MAG: hypothetical protein A2583_04325 [Bdellovibrionales bacterium RIFOXYD1_FULL_53_11]